MNVRKREVKKESLDESEIFSYEEYVVYEAIKARDKNVVVNGPKLCGNTPYVGDLYAPEGLPSLNLKGNTIIEVKRILSYSTVQFITNLYREYGHNYNILVVYFDSTISNIPIDSSENRNSKTLKYISFKELKGRRRAGKSAKAFYEEKARKDWRKERDEILKRAQDIVAEGSNALFLGAGVSMSAKMPSWNDLLKGLMGEVKQLKEPTLNAFQELNTHILDECGDSYLIMARYLRTAIRLYDDKILFSELIQKYLYNDNNTSELLVTLARIIQFKKVNEVITYNFDDILEQNLKMIHLRDSVDFTTISKDADIKGHNTLPIYHVHGIIPQKGAVDKVVFSEEEYHSRYSNAFHWSNIEQLHALSRLHCFFIGLSMTDPNLRRLLDAAQKNNEPNGDCHFAFLRRTKLDCYCISNIEHRCKYVHVSESLIDKHKQKEIYDLNYSVIESIFMELGIKIIWFEEFEELPGLVAQVFGLTRFQIESTRNLIEQCACRIKKIKQIETQIPSFNPVTFTTNDVVNFISYKNAHAEKYRTDVLDVRDMLNQLSERVDYARILEQDKESLLEIQKSIPKYNYNLSGFGDFYGVWLETVKKLLGRNKTK